MREECSAAALSSSQPATMTCPFSSSSTFRPSSVQKKDNSILSSPVQPIA